jgi:RNA polymerase sigma-70 factor (ECF subfamily)
VELDETVTLGFLHVLERLGPVERAVFLLREVFDVGYEEIAAIVGRSEDACRQTAHRARERVRAERPRFAVEPARRRALVEAFMVAVSSGDAASLERLLHDDVAMLSDGGAGRHAARRPVRGPSRVARLMVNLAKRLHAESVVDVVEANGELAVLVSRDDQPELLVEFEFDAGQLRRIHTVVNPDKLAAVLAAASPLQ